MDNDPNYVKRAKIARWALGANLVEEVVYGYTTFDGTEEVLKSENN